VTQAGFAGCAHGRPTRARPRSGPFDAPTATCSHRPRTCPGCR
jgi:hypothetical protein